MYSAICYFIDYFVTSSRQKRQRDLGRDRPHKGKYWPLILGKPPVSAGSTCNLDLAFCRTENRHLIRHVCARAGPQERTARRESLPRYFRGPAVHLWPRARKSSVRVGVGFSLVVCVCVCASRPTRIGRHRTRAFPEKSRETRGHVVVATGRKEKKGGRVRVEGPRVLRSFVATRRLPCCSSSITRSENALSRARAAVVVLSETRTSAHQLHLLSGSSRTRALSPAPDWWTPTTLPRRAAKRSRNAAALQRAVATCKYRTRRSRRTACFGTYDLSRLRRVSASARTGVKMRKMRKRARQVTRVLSRFLGFSRSLPCGCVRYR